MTDEGKAGQLILTQLKMFNEAAVHFEQIVEPAILSGIDSCVKTFADDNDWDGEYELANECWLAPKTWITNPDEEEPEFKAWFEMTYTENDNDNDYWTALFCGLASQGGQAGFMFSIDYPSFGGKSAWNAWYKKVPQELISGLTDAGFQNKDKGRFFLPVLLSNEQLAQSWREFGEFTAGDDAFIPLRAALEKLKEAIRIFDQIMQSCVAPIATN